jgi:hypothetical protein
MQDERKWHQFVTDTEVAGSTDREERMQSSCYSAQQTDSIEAALSFEPSPRKSAIPIAPGWDQRPGADLPHFGQPSKIPRGPLGWVDKIKVAALEAVAPGSARIFPVCILAGTIVVTFATGWLCGSTSYSLRNSVAETLSPVATTSSIRGAASGKQAGSATDNVATSVPPSSRIVGGADQREILKSFQGRSAAASAAIPTLQQRTTALGTGASESRSKSSQRRLTPAPETRPATIDGWTVRGVYGETVVLAGADRVWTVKPGDYVPGVGRIDSITRWGSRWIVVTASGLISTP